MFDIYYWAKVFGHPSFVNFNFYCEIVHILLSTNHWGNLVGSGSLYGNTDNNSYTAEMCEEVSNVLDTINVVNHQLLSYQEISESENNRKLWLLL